MFSTLLVAIPVILVLLAISAFFSSSETAIFALSTESLDAQDTSKNGRALAALREDPHRLLVTLLVGNNVVNIAITSITTAVLVESLPGGLAVPVATLVVSVLVLVFGEIVPKSYGFGNAGSWALRVARPITLVGKLLGPIVTLFDYLTRTLSEAIGGDPSMEERFLDK